MRIPTIRGVIDRRILVNFRADPGVLARLLPPAFRPKLVNGAGMAGVCLIRLKVLRQDGSPVELSVAASVVNGRTIAVLTFAGPDVVGGSLADGGYTLTVRADRVHDASGRQLDGDGDGVAGGDRADRVARLFGDSDGDGDVDDQDRDRFRSAFGTTGAGPAYLWYFDFDADGDVDGRDNGQFNRRFGLGR